MNVYQMSMVAVMGLILGCVGLGKGTSDSDYLAMMGFLVCISFLIQTVRMLQKQIDELKSAAQKPKQEEVQ
jgi:hypothetical protein